MLTGGTPAAAGRWAAGTGRWEFMLTGGTPAAPAGGPRQLAETGIARAETLGPDGGQQTGKPGPGGAEGPTDAKESAHNLFPLGMLKQGKGAGARGGGPRDMGEEVGRPGAGARHATQPAPGTAAGGRDAVRQQRHEAGRGAGQLRVNRRGAKVRYDTWHGLGGLPQARICDGIRGEHQLTAGSSQH
jgi:hypothetical protein